VQHDQTHNEGSAFFSASWRFQQQQQQQQQQAAGRSSPFFKK